MADDSPTTVTLKQRDGYAFDVTFAPQMPQLATDEPPPLGHAQGPSPSHLLLAAVGNCMSSSLTFALGKFGNTAQGLATTVRGHVGRNAANRLRVLRIEVDLQLGAAASSVAHLDRILAQFEEFCTVGASVRQGIPIDVSVFDSTGARLK